MGDGLGLQGAWGLASLQASIRQRQLDRMAAQQREFENMIALRGANRADAQQQILMQEHAATLDERRKAMEQAGRAASAKLYAPGDILSPGTGLPSTPEMTLPSTQMGRGMPTPPGVSSSLDTSTPDTAAPSPMVGTLRAAPDVMSSTPSPAAATGREKFAGTAEWRQQQEDEAALRQMVNDPAFKQMTPAQQYVAMRTRLPKGENPPWQLLQSPESQTEPVMRISPASGKVEQIGTARKGAHFVTQPPPAQPIVIQTGTGPQLVNRGAGTASPITRAGTGDVVGPPVPAAVQMQEHQKKEALNTLDQLDQAIEAAKDFIGPGAGRVSNIEQMAGFADPRVQALGTKMLIAKMRVDAGIGGMRAAASPQILARWDNLLANKVTPEGLKASVQAMREILGGTTSQTSGGVKVLSIERVK